MYEPGARQFVENRFVDMTIGSMRLLVDATFRQVPCLVEKIVKYDILSKLSTQLSAQNLFLMGKKMKKILFGVCNFVYIFYVSNY